MCVVVIYALNEILCVVSASANVISRANAETRSVQFGNTYRISLRRSLGTIIHPIMYVYEGRRRITLSTHSRPGGIECSLRAVDSREISFAQTLYEYTSSMDFRVACE